MSSSVTEKPQMSTFCTSAFLYFSPTGKKLCHFLGETTAVSV